MGVFGSRATRSYCRARRVWWGDTHIPSLYSSLPNRPIPSARQPTPLSCPSLDPNPQALQPNDMRPMEAEAHSLLGIITFRASGESPSKGGTTRRTCTNSSCRQETGAATIRGKEQSDAEQPTSGAIGRLGEGAGAWAWPSRGALPADCPKSPWC